MLILPALVSWAVAHPQEARSRIARLKRRWRAYLIRRHGRQAAISLFRALRTEAAACGIGLDLVETFIQNHADEVALRLGREEADRLLGEPTPLERYF